MEVGKQRYVNGMRSCDTLLIYGDKVISRLPLNKLPHSVINNVEVAVKCLYKIVSIVKRTITLKNLHSRSASKQNGTPQPGKFQ